jgi:putative ABC transport system substrate-binding protein
MSYRSDETETYHLLGVYAGSSQGRKKPANLPVQQSTSVQLTVNLKSAKALGLTIPPALLARAND